MLKYNYIYFVVSFILFFTTCMFCLETHGYVMECTVINVSFLFVCLLYCYILTYNGKTEVFHPIHIYFIFYILIFFLTPRILIHLNDTLCGGVNVMGGCVKATFIVVFGLFSFSLGYLLTKTNNVMHTIKPIPNISRQKILRLSYYIFAIVYIISFLYAMRSGKTIFSILSFGGIGYVRINQNPNDQLLFLINVSYALIVPWLFICAYSRSIFIKILLSYLMLSLYFSYGWRFITYIMVLSFMIVTYRRLGIKPKIRQIIVALICLLLFSVVQGSVRNSIRRGDSVSFQGFTIDNIAYTLKSNFNIYQPFYGVVEKYPDQYNYYYGQACFVYPFIMWIPRFIWHGKPAGDEYPATIAVKRAVSDKVISKMAFSYPNIFEYYIDFGLLGVMLFSFAIGVICKKMIKKYNSNSLYDIITYAVFIGFLIQFINRGYIAMLITLFVFLFSPLLLYRKYYRENDFSNVSS